MTATGYSSETDPEYEVYQGGNRLPEEEVVTLIGPYDEEIVVELTPPKTLFPQPGRRPRAPEDLHRPAIVDEPAAPESESAVGDGFLRPAEYVTTIIIIFATIAWTMRRDRDRRAAFDEIYRRLETELKMIPLDPSHDEELRRDSLRNRRTVANRRLGTLHLLTEEVGKASRKCPWDPRGNRSRNLRRCTKDISGRMVKMERAAEEIRVMLDVEELLRFLSDAGGGEDRRDRLGPETDGSCTDAIRSTHADGNSGAETVDHGTGSFSRLFRQAARLVLGSRGTTSAPDPCPPPQGEARQRASSSERGHTHSPPARLATRVKAMLSFNAGEGAPCVFREELERWDEELSSREQTAVNQLSLGLRHWDLKTVDKALQDLHDLGLPDLAESFQPEKERVWNKRWELKEELRDALNRQEDEGYLSRLRRALVKAETFYATDLPEYECAKSTLRDLRAREMEAQAKRILVVNNLPPDSSCNVRMDEAEGPVLLLPPALNAGTQLLLQDDPQQHGAHVNRAPYSGEVKPLLFGSVGGEGVTESCYDGSYDADGSGEGSKDAESGEAGSSQESLSWNGRWDGKNELVATGTSQEVSVAQQQRLQQQRQDRRQVALGLQAYQSARGKFLEYITNLEQEQRRCYEADRNEIEKREDKALYHRDQMRLLEARKGQEDRRLELEASRQKAEDEERLRRRRERERKSEMDRLDMLWSYDADFLRMLAVGDVVAYAAMIMWHWTITPWIVGEALWRVMMADCRDEPDASAPQPALVAVHAAIPGGIGEGPGLSICGLQPLEGVNENIGECVMSEDSRDGLETSSTLWWAFSSVGSATGIVIEHGFSWARWLLGQTLALVTPNIECEVRASIAMASWVVGLIVSLRVASLLAGDDRGPGTSIAHVTVVVLFVWGRFHSEVVNVWWGLVMPGAVAPVSVLCYGPVFRYLEKHVKLKGWWWRGWDVRPLVSRALPGAVGTALAIFLGASVARTDGKSIWG